MKTSTKLWLSLIVLALLTPLGLYLPHLFKADDAWGEWSPDKVKSMVGFVPKGIEKASSAWNAAMPDYGFKGWEAKGIKHSSVAYLFSALLGIGVIAVAAFIIGKLLTSRGGFVQKTIEAIVTVLKQSLENQDIAMRSGFMQHREAPLKAVAVCLLLLSVLISKSILMIGVLYMLTLALATASSISLLYFFKRTVLFVPLFAGIIALPALFSTVTPGRAVVSFSVASHLFSITREGLQSASLFCMRVLASVSLAVLLVLTTRHHTLLKVLRLFRVPQLFVMTMGMTYRYIYLLLDTVHNTFTAIKSRVGFVASAKTGRRIVAENIASLWLKSYRLHHQVYSAMVSRGYGGEPVTMETFGVRFSDCAFAFVTLIIFCGTLWMNTFSH